MIFFDLKQDIILENDRTLLSPLQLSDVEKLLPIAEKHTDLLKYSPSRFHNKSFMTNYIRSALSAKSLGIRYPFIIFDKKHQRYAGSTSFGSISNPNQRLEIGWTWITKELQGTGLNKSNKFLMLQYAFEILKFERVEFKTDSRNLQSRRAMKKIGCTYEGELRSHTLMPDGFRRNTVYYSILNNEWQAIKSTIFKDM